ncbi:MAG TPA: HEAT repeat domain-containing protein [Planctomycetota bacterium]|nr:HEAT repeat domain-containing protein [Planctomycetota bacterium]
MRKNAMLIGAGGVVVVAALAATGWLFLRGSPPPRRTLDVPRVVRTDTAKKVELPVVKRMEPAKIAPAPKPVSAPGPKAPIDVCARVEELLKEFDAIYADGGGPIGPGEVARINTLRERSQKIDRVVAELAALGPEAIPCLADQFRADSRPGVNRIERQSVEVRALAKIPACKDVVQVLGEAYLATEAWGVKMTIIAQLAEASCPEGLDFLCSRVDLDQDFRLRTTILKFLGQRKVPCGIQAAQRIAAQDENVNVRIAALRALAEAEDPSSRLVLEDRARSDPDITVRQNAIQAYGRVMKEQALPVLDDLLQRDSNIRIKSIVILALQELNCDAARRVLERTRDDASAGEDIRARANGALAAMDRMQNGAGLPSVGAKLDALNPTNLDGMKPLGPAGAAGGKH